MTPSKEANMKSGFWTTMALTLGAALALGCGPTEKSAAPSTPAKVVEHGHDHSGWWCTEHGVPESVCALCDSKLAADFQKKGDWCKEHDRPDSQCFTCHPELEAKFAAQYEAKFGKKPPVENDTSHANADSR